MKTMKKIFASLLVICMMLTIPAITSLADTTLTLGPGSITIEAGDDDYHMYSFTAQEAGTLKIDVKTPEGLYSAALYNPADYNTPVCLADFSGVEPWLDGGAVANDTGDGYVLSWNCTAGMSVAFEVCSKGDAQIKVDWDSLFGEEGKEGNPAIISDVADWGKYEALASLADGTSFFYKYTAEVEGQAKFYFLDNLSFWGINADIIVTKNNENPLKVSTDGVEERDGMQRFQKLTVDTVVGDILKIEVKMISNEEGASSTDLPWVLDVFEKEGTAGNPFTMPEMPSIDAPYEITIPAGQTVYVQGIGEEYENTSITISGGAADIVMTGWDIEQGGPVPTDKVVTEDGTITTKTITTIVNLGIGNRKAASVVAITNTGSAEATYKISYKTLVGFSEEHAVEFGMEEETVELTANDGRYFFKWVQEEEAAYLKIEVNPLEANMAWTFYVENATTEERSEDHYSSSTEVAAVNTEYIKANKDDVVYIAVMAFDSATNKLVDSTLKVKVTEVTAEEATTNGMVGNITGAADGTSVPVQDADGKDVTSVPENAMSAVKGNDVTLTITGKDSVYVWSINGKDVTTAKPLDLTITNVAVKVTEALIDAVAGDTDVSITIPVVIAHNGEFGAKATLTYVVGDEYFEEYANLFHYNETSNKLEFVAAQKVSEEGTVAFEDMTHASEYVIVVGEDLTPAEQPPVENPSPEELPGMGDVSVMVIYGIILLGAALTAVVFANKKRFA